MQELENIFEELARERLAKFRAMGPDKLSRAIGDGEFSGPDQEAAQRWLDQTHFRQTRWRSIASFWLSMAAFMVSIIALATSN